MTNPGEFHSSLIIHRSSLALLVSREGIEPSTDGLKARCSTTELPARSCTPLQPRGVWLNKTDPVGISGERRVHEFMGSWVHGFMSSWVHGFMGSWVPRG
jgi:hypothetical protein